MSLMAHGEAAVITVILQSMNELRIRVPPTEYTESKLRVLPPTHHREVRFDAVEVNGAPLKPGTEYLLLPGTSHSIVCWSATSVRIEIEGSDRLMRDMFRLAESPTAQPVAEYHTLINEWRGSSTPPVVLICGHHAAPKAAIATTLVNYAARLGWAPTLVDLDPSENQFVSIPGSVGAAVIECPVALDEDVLSHHIATQLFVGSLTAQNHALGVNNSGRNDNSTAFSPVWRHQARVLLEMLRRERASHCVHSGSIIIAPDLQGADGANVIVELARQAFATHILCLHDDRLIDRLLTYFIGISRADTADVDEDADGVGQGQRVFDTLNPSWNGASSVTIDTIYSVSAALHCSSLDSITLAKRKLESFFNGSSVGQINSFVCVVPLKKVTLYRPAARADGKVMAVLIEKTEHDAIVHNIFAVVDASQAKREMGGFLSCHVCGYGRIERFDGQNVWFRTNLAELGSSDPSHITMLVGDVQLLTDS